MPGMTSAARADRRRKVFARHLDGRSQAEIARELDISWLTVHRDITHILEQRAADDPRLEIKRQAILARLESLYHVARRKAADAPAWTREASRILKEIARLEAVHVRKEPKRDPVNLQVVNVLPSGAKEAVMPWLNEPDKEKADALYLEYQRNGGQTIPDLETGGDNPAH